MISERDKGIVRELAKRYMAEALSEKQLDMNRRMQATNDLKIVRPIVLMDEIPWYQMDIDGELKCECENGAARGLEFYFRSSLYRRKYHACDTIFDPVFKVRKSYDSTGIGINAKEEIRRTDDINHIVSHHYEDILEDEENLELIKIPTFTARPDKDEYSMNFYTDLLGDTMPVEFAGYPNIYHAPWDFITRLRGMEPILFDLYDRPEYLHKIRKRFMDIALAEIDFVEKNTGYESWTSNVHCTPGLVSGVQSGKGTWFRGMAQNFGDVSPEMHKEFDIDYAIPIAEHFTYSYYGCCEPLDRKIEMLKCIKNLRKIGVSPWANEESSAEQIKGDFVYARKPNPANVAIKTDPEVIRKETEVTVKACQKHGCPVEFVLKDISTVSGKPENLIIWAKTVSEVLDKYY